MRQTTLSQGSDDGSPVESDPRRPSDRRTLERTSVPGVFRRGNRYVVRYRDPDGNDRKKSARTLREAREIKAATQADIARGEYRAISPQPRASASRANPWMRQSGPRPPA